MTTGGSERGRPTGRNPGLRRSEAPWIRLATAEDAEGLSRVQKVSWQVAYRGILSDSFLDVFEPAPSRWIDRLATGVHIEVAILSDVIVGYCSVASADVVGFGELRALYVDPRHQGLGIGSLLLETGMNALERRGFDRALLWVLEQNAMARSFYEGRGWGQARPIRIEEIGGTQVTLVRYDRDPPSGPRPGRDRRDTSP